MQKREVDVVVIGAGTAGMTAYRAAARAGKKVVLVEGGAFGTTCARVGCMPSKLLIAAADAAHAARNTAPFGVHVDGEIRVDGTEVMHRVNTERDRFVSFVLDDIASFPSEDKVLGYAKFIDDQTIQVDDHTQITANSFVLATGTSPFIPQELAAVKERVVVNDDLFEWEQLPRHVVVLGAGVIAMELGQALSRLGVQLSILNRSARLAGISDPVIQQSAQAIFSSELDLRCGAVLTRTELMGDQVAVYYESNGIEHCIQTDYILSAAGRTPNLQGLGLENTSAHLDDKGMPDFDPETLLIRNTTIFFAGDVNAQHPILHEAADDGFQSGQNAANWPNQPQPVARRAPMGVVFTDPQVMRVGTAFKDLSLAETAIGEVNFAHQGRSRVILKNQGYLRVYANKNTGRFLGAEMIGPAAEHLAHLLAWSLQAELTIEQMLAMPFYHPVIEEGLRTALRDARAKS